MRKRNEQARAEPPDVRETACRSGKGGDSVDGARRNYSGRVESGLGQVRAQKGWVASSLVLLEGWNLLFVCGSKCPPSKCAARLGSYHCRVTSPVPREGIT